jgi:hypothetical protein
MYGQSQCHYHDQEDGGGNNYRLAHGVIVAGTAPLRAAGLGAMTSPRDARS